MQSFTMNHDLYKYCLGKRKRPGTETAKAIDRLVSAAPDSENADDRGLLQEIASVLSNASILDEDAFRFLRPLHGCGGSEGYVLDVERAVEAAFWKSLSERFADHQGLSYIAADAALLADDPDSARELFMQGLRIDPGTFPPFAVDWQELLSGTEWHFEYRLHLLAQALKSDPEDSAAVLAELTDEYRGAPERQQSIDDVARGGDVPRLTPRTG
jgi:hypothetical protein